MDPERFDNMTSEWSPGDPAPDPQGLYPVNPEIRQVDGAVFQPERVARAIFGVRDLEVMTRFFQDVGGLSRIEGNGDDRSVVLGGTLGLPDLTLVQVDDGEGEGLRQFSFEMAGQEGLDMAEVEMEKAAIRPELREDDEGKRSISLRDPDGFSYRVLRGKVKGRGATHYQSPSRLMKYGMCRGAKPLCRACLQQAGV